MPIDKELKEAIEKSVREIIRNEITDKLQNLERQVDSIVHMQKSIVDMQATLTQNVNRIEEIEKLLSFASAQIVDIEKTLIPSVNKKSMDVSTKLCMNVLDMDTHRRKWSIIINGLEGEEKESEIKTCKMVRDFAKNCLKVKNVDNHKFAACHRLGSGADSGIIVKFVDLTERNEWLFNAKNLKGSQKKVSLSPDLHPCLRKLKNSVLLMRKSLENEEKKGSQVRFCPSWPYVYLRLTNAEVKYPQISKETIVNDYLKMQ